MIRDLHFPVQMKICPTVREQDGLAMSSRNAYLTPSQRHHALVVHKALSTIESLYRQGQRHAPTLIKAGTDVIDQAKREIQADDSIDWDIALDYLSINSPEDLSAISGDINPQEGGIVSTAVFVGKTRLIDNLLLDVKTES